MMDRLNKFMENLKRQNPNANWANLLTGVAVLVMVAVFSYAYFSKSRVANIVIDDSKLVEEITKDTKGASVGKDQNPVVEGETIDTSPAVTAEPGEKGSVASSATTVVQKGEGLWHVAQRVCGDGEKYNTLATANGLSVWEELNEGMTLKVVCN